jgi:hypothetical protein
MGLPSELGRAARLVAAGGWLTMRLLVPRPQCRIERPAAPRPPALRHLAEGMVLPVTTAGRYCQAQPKRAKNGELLSIVGRVLSAHFGSP